jgi:hypothetical protein
MKNKRKNKKIKNCNIKFYLYYFRSFSIEMGYNQADKSMFNKTNKSLEKIDEEFLPYEEQVIYLFLF